MTRDPERRTTSAGVVTLACLAVVGALYLGRDVLEPIALSLLVSAVLYPVVRWLHARLRLPMIAGAALVVVASAALLVVVVLLLVPALRSLAADVPRSLDAARGRLARLPGPLGVSFVQLAERARGGGAQSASGGAGGAGAGGAPPGVGASVAHLFGTTTAVLATTFETLLLALFVLAAGDAWRRRLDDAVRSPTVRAHVVEATQRIRSSVARYVLATALINLGQGALVGLVAWLLHLPTPPLWGALTFVAEFVPYLGGAAMIVLLLVAGLASGGGARVLAMPAAYLTITTLQNNLVSPFVYGRGLRLNPMAILVSVMLWWALWGVTGAFLAVPILAALQVVAERIDALRPVGAFIEG